MTRIRLKQSRAFGGRSTSPPDPLNLPPTAAQVEAADPKVGAGLCTGGTTPQGTTLPSLRLRTRERVDDPDGNALYDVIDGERVNDAPMGPISDVHGPYGGRAA